MYYLVLIALLQLNSIKPVILAPPAGQEACAMAAATLNHSDASLQQEEAKQLGAVYVCLKMEYAV